MARWAKCGFLAHNKVCQAPIEELRPIAQLRPTTQLRPRLLGGLSAGCLAALSWHVARRGAARQSRRSVIELRATALLLCKVWPGEVLPNKASKLSLSWAGLPCYCAAEAPAGHAGASAPQLCQAKPPKPQLLNHGNQLRSYDLCQHCGVQELLLNQCQAADLSTAWRSCPGKVPGAARQCRPNVAWLRAPDLRLRHGLAKLWPCRAPKFHP